MTSLFLCHTYKLVPTPLFSPRLPNQGKEGTPIGDQGRGGESLYGWRGAEGPEETASFAGGGGTARPETAGSSSSQVYIYRDI